MSYMNVILLVDIFNKSITTGSFCDGPDVMFIRLLIYIIENNVEKCFAFNIEVAWDWIHRLASRKGIHLFRYILS